MSVSSLQPSKIPLEQRTAKIALMRIKILMITMMRIKIMMITMMRIKIMMITMQCPARVGFGQSRSEK